jgi:hypothetical protein
MQRRLALAIMLLATEAIYLPWFVLHGTNTLYGWDYMFLHARRLAFARDALLGPRHQLPGWYPREMLGTPFAANLQDFPWIPTHLPLLFFDPDKAYAVGIALAAALAALFTYLFCRRLGLSPIGAAAAGWTFACSGFFAANVMVGHLVNLEGYPALPLLLWLSDRATATNARRSDAIALAIGTACVVLAGHPQLPAYAVVVALLYVLWRGRAKLAGVIMLGIGATMIAWWPMLLLIRRSSRSLPLDPAANDVALPYHRLLGLIAPGTDGWPAGVNPAAHHLFVRYSHPAYFWDTFAYTGILPLAAAAILVLVCIAQRRVPSPRWLFLAILAAVALLVALPLLDPLRHALPITIFRSPARLLYLGTFSLAAAFGAGVDALRRWKRLGWALVAACLAFHAWDLGSTSRVFITPGPLHPLAIPEFASEVGNGRIAVSRVLDLQLAYDHDDAGGFDAIFLADTYRSLLALTGAPPRSNEEVLDASTWPVSALQGAGVQFVVAWPARTDLEPVKSAAGLQMDRVPNPAPRGYSRLNSDLIEVHSSLPRPGAVPVLEAYDPGWTAEVDGAPAPVREAHPLGMDVPVPAGDHLVRLRYHTPGRTTGAILSLVSMCLLILLVAAPMTASTTVD